ncbi:MAG: hypothetical protein JSU96_08780, partial [Acidobacteriota bacterium]
MKISGRSFVLACWALLALVNSINAQKLEEERWDPEGLGNHRAVVSVQEEADVVWADLEWRRRDAAPGEKAIIVVDGATGEQIDNVIVMNADRIAGRVAFQPATVPSDYWIYFLPYQMEGRRNYPTARYLSAQETASPQWLRQNGLEAEEVAWEDFPRAEFLRFESNESVNAFTEMERVATEAEVQGLVERFAPFGFVLIPETREHPIRMSEDLPFRWAGRQPGEPFRATAAKGEFLAFQLGVYSPTASLDEVSLEFSDLRLESGGELISASRFRCFNLGGIDWTGKPFKRPVSLAAGKVHALWLGLDVPMAVSAGEYRGMISVGTESGLQQTVPVTIEVGNQTLEDSGDSDPFRLSRLRWLDSTIALDDTVVPPYEPISVKGKKLTILGRSIELGEDGLPSGIESYFAPEMTRLQDEPRAILSSPVRMHVELSGSGKVEGWTGEGLSFEKIGKSEVSWQSRRTSRVLSLETTASLEFDGNLEFEVKVSTTEPVQLSDIWLEVPIKEDVARYMMGLGYRGGTRPDQFDWKWDPTKNQDSVWLGDVNAGLQVSWKDQNYVRPLNTNFYLLKPLQMPTSWYNGGAGGCELRHTGQNYRIRTFSGERKLQPGHPLHFKFRLLITPFKPIDPPRQWANRFYHNYEPIETIREQGANVINIHHANELNPYINYPFLSVEKLKNYIDQAHAEDLKVKIYYTVRELSTRAPELFALRSLGDDVLAYGPGGGSSWMQEHL